VRISSTSVVRAGGGGSYVTGMIEPSFGYVAPRAAQEIFSCTETSTKINLAQLRSAGIQGDNFCLRVTDDQRGDYGRITNKGPVIVARRFPSAEMWRARCRNRRQTMALSIKRLRRSLASSLRRRPILADWRETRYRESKWNTFGERVLISFLFLWREDIRKLSISNARGIR
jgi:hypothetical protein